MALSKVRSKAVSKERLKEEAERNTTVSKKVNGSTEVVKAGVPLDHTNKKVIDYTGTKFGMSKGGTFNMDNYESCRIDVWLNSEVQEGETLEEALMRVEEVLDLKLAHTLKKYR